MATEKRSRQRVNRKAKRAAEQKRARRAKMIRRARRLVFYAAIFAFFIFLATQMWGGGDDRSLGLLYGA